MTSSVPFPLPPGRALSTWRRDLAAFRPRRLWLAHLLLHRVECLVRVARRRPLDPFRAALLGQLAANRPPEQLLVDRELLGHWLRDLSAEGLADSAGRWRLTERGRDALAANAYPVSVEERRVFTFLDADEPGRPPRYLALHGPAVPLEPPAGWRFDAAALDECLRRPEDWKTRHGFPTDVEAVLAPPAPEARTAADWRRVILDRPEQILLVFVTEAEAAPRLRGFAVRPEDWVLQTAAPALALAEAEEIPPGVGGEPTPEAWREAWRAWCEGRDLPDADVCRVQAEDNRIRVVAPRPLTERLGGERTDAWLLAGVGRTRVAAPLEIVQED